MLIEGPPEKKKEYIKRFAHIFTSAALWACRSACRIAQRNLEMRHRCVPGLDGLTL